MKTKFVMAATVLAVVVSVVLVALVAPGSGGERSVVAQAPPEDREYGYLDQVHNAYILAQWNPLHPSFGAVVVQERRTADSRQHLCLDRGYDFRDV